jgi:hypothetical protein
MYAYNASVGKNRKEIVMERLYYRIEYLRQKMHETALKKGISHPDVLMVSQKLDEVINEFYHVGLIQKAG